MKYKLPGSGLLSYSGMQMFLSCPRKYAYRYFDNVQPEFEEKTSPMDRGKAFHLLAEQGQHAQITDIVKDPYEEIKVRTAYWQYAELERNGILPQMSLREVKIVDEENQYIGYVDMLRVEESGKWMLGELKTTAKFDPVRWATLKLNTQIALYTKFAKSFAHEQFLDLDDLQGVSYRTVVFSGKKPLAPTKGGKRKQKENPDDYGRRIANDTQVHHRMVTVAGHTQSAATETFELVKSAISSMDGSSKCAPRNTGNCFLYGRACEFFHHCHGVNPADLSANTDEGRIIHDSLDGV